MKIHCIALTKNEEDVVGFCLKEAAKWADHIYVYDGDSTDGTWEIAKSLASETIIPWKQDGKVFSEGLRAEVFNEFRHLSTEGDVDEFHLGDLRQTLAGIPGGQDFVWGIPIEYYITWKDLENMDFSWPVDQLLPALRYYRIDWSGQIAHHHRR
jgi:glycosyltransferase involved in cell wall biosynthesis